MSIVNVIIESQDQTHDCGTCRVNFSFSAVIVYSTLFLDRHARARMRVRRPFCGATQFARRAARIGGV